MRIWFGFVAFVGVEATLLSETLQGPRVWFNMHELIHARLVIRQMDWDEQRESGKDTERERQGKREGEKIERSGNVLQCWQIIKRDWMREKKEKETKEEPGSEWMKGTKGKSKHQNESGSVREWEKGCVTAKWIYVCVFMNTPLKSKYMTALMGYWSSHRTWWMELK